ncbi:MAG: GntR family transcriptional regulator [Desulfobacteraceae bacterium]|nr:GntR family transcriptional regulator [Desulfobacteraceae bacterium]MBC2719799.1 GntR family transcriptional regulator [Desulfobacteraceae bacterium]
MLNSKSPIPLYHQLADIIITKIRSGEYPPGSRIPSENRLAATYGIGRPTARQATDVLVRKRMLVRKRGSGTFVGERPKEVDLFSLAGTISSFHKKGISITTQIIKNIRMETVENDSENPFLGQDVYFFSRLSRVEDMPVLIEDIYLHASLFSGIERFNLQGRSLSQIVEAQYYMRPTGGKQNFRIGYLTGEKAKSLDISSNIPILAVKRFLHFEQAKNAIYSELFCRTDRFVFSQSLFGN